MCVFMHLKCECLRQTAKMFFRKKRQAMPHSMRPDTDRGLINYSGQKVKALLIAPDTHRGVKKYTGQKVKGLNVTRPQKRNHPHRKKEKNLPADDECTRRYQSVVFENVCRNSLKFHQKGRRLAWKWLRMPLHAGLAEYETWLGFLHLLFETGYGPLVGNENWCARQLQVPPGAEEILKKQFGEWPKSLCQVGMLLKGIHDGLGTTNTSVDWCDCWDKPDCCLPVGLPGEKRTMQDCWNYIALRKSACNIFTKFDVDFSHIT